MCPLAVSHPSCTVSSEQSGDFCLVVGLTTMERGLAAVVCGQVCGAGCSQHQHGLDWKIHLSSRSLGAGAVLWSLGRGQGKHKVWMAMSKCLSLVVQTEVGVGVVGHGAGVSQ